MAIPRDAIVGLALLAIAGLYWLGADVIPRSPLSGTVGAEGLPKALAYALAGLAAVLIARSFLEKRAAAAEWPQPEEVRSKRRDHLRALGVLMIGIGYIVLLPYLGYGLSVVLLVAAAAWYNGRPLSWTLLVTAVGAGVFFYLLFVLFLDIRLPAGVWPRLIAGFPG